MFIWWPLLVLHIKNNPNLKEKLKKLVSQHFIVFSCAWEDWSSYSSPLFIVFYQASCLIFSKGLRLLAIWNYILANNWTTLGVVVCADEFLLIQVLVCNLLHVAGKPCTVYDAIFHPDTYKKGQEVWLSSLRYQTIFYVNVSVIKDCQITGEDDKHPMLSFVRYEFISTIC